MVTGRVSPTPISTQSIPWGSPGVRRPQYYFTSGSCRPCAELRVLPARRSQYSVGVVADVLTRDQRRRCMANIRGKDTKPEVLVRSLLRSIGVSFKTHAAELPGKPDIVLRSRRQAILVHGCFWHRHSCVWGQVIPGTRADFWVSKLDANRQRDARNLRALKRLGWRVLVVWECETRKPTQVLSRLERFLTS